jgi:hypothetical protein
MNKKEFLNSIRRPGVKFRADNIVVATGTEELSGKGLLHVEDGHFQLLLTLSGSAPAPEGKTGVVTNADFWTVRGLIEDEIEFQMRSLPDCTSRNFTFGRGERHILEFSNNRLQLVPCGFDCLTNQQQWEMQEAARLRANPSAPQEKVQHAAPVACPVRVTFQAVLLDFKLLDHNGGTETTTKNAFLGESSRSKSDTFHGKLRGWEFGLIERDGDLHVHLVSEDEYQSEGEHHDWLLFSAFLNAIAFTHGQHAWPFTVEHRRDGKLLLDRIQLDNEVAATPHAPFTEALAFGNAVGGPAWSFREALEKAHVFFSTKSKLARECETILYILREASSRGVPRRITLLSLCSLLESLVRVIYEERIELEKTVETGEFQTAKQEILKDLRERNQPRWKRLIAILSNAEPVNNRLRFGAVIEHLGLTPQDKWQELYGLWSKFRNPISHRMSQNNDSDPSVQEDLLAESKLAGAINCMILKLMNYAGPVRLSTYEDKYTRI